MELTVRVDSYEDWVIKYLAIWNESLKLTATEMKLASLLIASYMRFVDDGLKEPYLSKFVFGTENQKEIHSKFENKDGNKISDQRFRSLFKALMEKGLVVDVTGDSRIARYLIPTKNLNFTFKLEEKA